MAKDTKTTTEIQYNPNWEAYGVSQDIWGRLNPLQKSQISIALNYNLQNYATNASSLTVQDAVAAASKDPNIIAKYADTLKIDTQDFKTGLDELQLKTRLTSDAQRIQFEQDKKNLLEQEASMGAAYSGFRGKAEQDLSKTEAGIIESTRSTTKNALKTAQDAFEQKYGSKALKGLINSGQVSPITSYTNPMTGATETITTAPIGGITGTETVGKSQDITNLARQNIELAKPVPITPISQ